MEQRERKENHFPYFLPKREVDKVSSEDGIFSKEYLSSYMMTIVQGKAEIYKYNQTQRELVFQ